MGKRKRFVSYLHVCTLSKECAYSMCVGIDCLGTLLTKNKKKGFTRPWLRKKLYMIIKI